jgi:hypothetical protein
MDSSILTEARSHGAETDDSDQESDYQTGLLKLHSKLLTAAMADEQCGFPQFRPRVNAEAC